MRTPHEPPQDFEIGNLILSAKLELKNSILILASHDEISTEDAEQLIQRFGLKNL